MSRRANKRSLSRKTPAMQKQNTVDSLLDVMEDGNEYLSIVGKEINPEVNLLEEVIRGLNDIEAIRERTCIAYLGDVVSEKSGPSGIDQSDDLPFKEMVDKVPRDINKVDVILSTRGGSAEQVNHFVNSLRNRFDEVDFIVPSFCMSAGTLFALSGDNIWMTERACLGPIDPQVPTKEGRYVPAQALVLLVDELQKQGEEAMQKGSPVPWTAVRIIDSLDKKELGYAITASNYSTMMATEFLDNYKLRNWQTRETSKAQVTPEYRKARAEEIANALVSHERWKNHGHSLSRELLWNELELKIEHPDERLNQAIIRLWALCNWIFEKTPVLKMMVSKENRYLKYKTKS